MAQECLLVIGGTAAGLSAASAARRLNKELKITVFEKTGYISYGSCGLPYYIGGLIQDVEELITFTPSRLESSRNISVKTHHEVRRIDRSAKSIQVCNLLSGEYFDASYDKLVIATGASARTLSVPGADKEGIFTVRHVEDGIAIRNALGNKGKNVVLIGAGYIGLEIAAELASCNHHVALIESLPSLLPAQPSEYSEMIQSALQAHGVQLLLATQALEFAGERHVSGVKTSRGLLPADVVILSVGVRPNRDLAQDAGLRMGDTGAISVDPHMRTSDPDIFACGDCAESFSMIDGSPVYIPLGTTANKQGKVAGQNIGGIQETFCGVLGSQITKIFDLYIGATGLTLAAAEKAGYDCGSCSITKSDKASYYPGGNENKITLVFEKRTGRILGASAVGGATVSGRLNVLAAAITAKMTLRELNHVDFVYAPPVAPVYDPLLIAASQSLKQI